MSEEIEFHGWLGKKKCMFMFFLCMIMFNVYSRDDEMDGEWEAPLVGKHIWP